MAYKYLNIIIRHFEEAIFSLCKMSKHRLPKLKVELQRNIMLVDCKTK